jgi:hypothetical protein
MKWLQKILETNLNAVLVTVLIHLLFVFVFLLFQLEPPIQQHEIVLEIDPESMEAMEDYFEAKEQVEEKMKALAEAQNLSLDDIRNLASNSKVAERKWESEAQRLSAEELQKQYEDELRKEMYGEDYDDVKQALADRAELEEFDFTASENDENAKKGNQSYYSGPALVKVELDNPEREHIFVDIPVFTCKGSGTVVVSILIDEYGKVIKADLVSVHANSDEDCLINSAIRSAKSSVFGVNVSRKQDAGTITYQFVPQI